MKIVLCSVLILSAWLSSAWLPDGNRMITQAVYTVLKTADQPVTSSTTLTNDTDLFFPVQANKKYAFRFLIPFNLAGILSGYKFQVSTPSAPSSFVHTARIENGATGGMVGLSVLTSISPQAGALATTGDHAGVWEGTLENGVNAGNLQFQFAQNVSSAPAITIKRGAYLTIMEVQ